MQNWSITNTLVFNRSKSAEEAGMKNRGILIAMLFISLILSSCSVSSKNTKFFPVKQKQPRQSSLGFSVTPPPGENWYEKLKNDSLVYLKIAESSHTYAILTEAREVELVQRYSNPTDFLEYVKEAKNCNLEKDGIRNSAAAYTFENSLSKYCVRYQQSYEDHNLHGLRGRRHVNVSQAGLFCRHPEYENAAIDISYQEKSLSDATIQSYKSEGEMFLSSLTFHAAI